MRQGAFAWIAAFLTAAMLACGDASDGGQPADAADTVAAEPEPDTTSGPAGSVSRRGDILDPSQTIGVTVTASEWGIAVQDSAITSGPVTIEMRNEGEMPHVIEITGEYAGRWRSAPIPPGGSALMSMSLGPGTYTVFCPETPDGQEAHRARGMEARLIVR